MLLAISASKFGNTSSLPFSIFRDYVFSIYDFSRLSICFLEFLRFSFYFSYVCIDFSRF
nr:MAG TPA: hypothetical protein [Caudoviricetes sp.]DAZ74651.1 MAG TPA: hypothetical protein [Caudoviricetes sp.]DAZ83586.1 MAG TPA: hypothetical protein [Caudoviricetes sp.]